MNNSPDFFRPGLDGVVPVLSVKIGGFHLTLAQLLLGDVDPGCLSTSVQFGVDAQAGLGGRIGNQVHDHFVTDQRSSPPVLGDMAEHPMLDKVLSNGDRYFP
jgi:hypothetical protein